MKMHPEFEAEAEQLRSVIEDIRSLVGNYGTRDLTGTDPGAVESVEEFIRHRMYGAEESIENPYFGRVDFEPEDSSSESYYIGHRALDLRNRQIYDWRAPLGSLFYGGVSEQQTYEAPGGIVRGRLLLKRRLKIVQAQLKLVEDEIDRRNGTADLKPDLDQALSRELSGGRSFRMVDIVETIQAEQDALIRAPYDRVLMINGVAGSGKTAIALHRLAYLLFPRPESEIRRDRTIVFAPNQTFVKYVEGLLPDLGERDIRHTTFEEWAKLNVPQLRNCEPFDSTLPLLLDSEVPIEQKRRRYALARLRSGLKMARLLERYASQIRTAPLLPDGDIHIDELDMLGTSLTLSPQDIAEISAKEENVESSEAKGGQPALAAVVSFLAKAYEEELNDRYWDLAEKKRQLSDGPRDALQSGHGRDGVSETSAHVFQSPAECADETEQQLENIDRQLRQLFDARVESRRRGTKLRNDIRKRIGQLWAETDALEAYYSLLEDPEVIQETATFFLNSEEVRLLSEVRRPPEGSVWREDLPAIIYLHSLLNRMTAREFDHIVVDEVQDASPMELKVLSQLAPSGSMTLVGDMAQGIFSYIGLSNWEEIMQALSDTDCVKVDVTRTYRATVENVDFGNGVLASLYGRRAIFAQAVPRHGPRPRLTEAGSDESMWVALCIDLRSVLDKYDNVAVIGKSPDHSREIALQLSVRGFQPVDIHSLGLESPRGRPTVVPVELAKGLEFDAVIVPNADANHYGKTGYDGRLLYVAVTRAAHELAVFWTYPMSPHLKLAAEHGDLRYLED